jgi:hypothetical protein
MLACGLDDRGSNLGGAKNVYSFIAPSFLNFDLVDHQPEIIVETWTTHQTGQPLVALEQGWSC